MKTDILWSGQTETRRALGFVLGALGIVGGLIPTYLIGVCDNPEHPCRIATQPAQLLSHFRNHADNIEKTVGLQDLIAWLLPKSNVARATDNSAPSNRRICEVASC